MAFVSNGVLRKSATVVQTFTPGTFNGWYNGDAQFRWGSYSTIYERQLWVAVLVNKLANATARLPLKVYQRTDLGRPENRDHPYAVLLRNPCPGISTFLFWLWVSSTKDIFGEAFLLKVRDKSGRPIQLVPWHPTGVVNKVENGEHKWELHRADGSHTPVARRDLVHFRTYNPSSLTRGMSPLEPLRSTLENETGARAANSAMWRNGGRPSTVLQHPGMLTDTAMRRLATSWADSHGGVDNWAKAAILEEGMTAQVIPLNVEELQYIEARKLNREETCAAYDVPPPVVHILDRATFSNITEQMRSMYRDTMAPKLRLIESALETELRDGRFGDLSIDPDFGEEVYAEFLMDEVMRGEFEVRSAAYSSAISNSWMTPAEVRAKENLPFIEGSDKLVMNSALVPVSPAGSDGMSPRALPAATVRSLMGRLSWQQDVKSIEPAVLVAGIGQADTVLLALAESVDAHESVDQFKDRLRALTEATQ